MVKHLIRSEVPAGIIRKTSAEVYQGGADNMVSDLEIWVGMRKGEPKTSIKESGVWSDRALSQ